MSFYVHMFNVGWGHVAKQRRKTRKQKNSDTEIEAAEVLTMMQFGQERVDDEVKPPPAKRRRAAPSSNSGENAVVLYFDSYSQLHCFMC